MKLSERWQDYFAGMALAARRGSKDASTKVGAVIYRPDRTTLSTGFNGLPSAIPDDPVKLLDRSWKYPRIIHAEANAIDKAKESLLDCGIVCTAHPCSACALKIVNSGIKTVYCFSGLEREERWREDMHLAFTIFNEAGIRFRFMKDHFGRD